MVNQLKFENYMRKIEIVSENYRQRRKEQTASAYCLGVISYAMAPPKSMSLKKYLGEIGLTEKVKPKSKEQIEKEAKEAKEKANNVIDMIKRKRGD